MAGSCVFSKSFADLCVEHVGVSVENSCRGNFLRTADVFWIERAMGRLLVIGSGESGSSAA